MNLAVVDDEGRLVPGNFDMVQLQPDEVLVFRSQHLMKKSELEAFWRATTSLREEYAKRGLGEPIMILVDGGDSIEAFGESIMNRLGWFKKKDAP